MTIKDDLERLEDLEDVRREVGEIGDMVVEALAYSRQALLHDLWLAIHSQRFLKDEGLVGGPDNFYNGILHAESLIEQYADTFADGFNPRQGPPPTPSWETE